MVGSSLHSKPFSADDLPSLVRLLCDPIVAPLKTAKRTIVILSLALAGCNSINAPSPTTQVTTLKIFADSAATPLLLDLAKSYHPPHMLVTWDIQFGEARSVVDWLASDDTSYALLDYVPELLTPNTPFPTTTVTNSMLGSTPGLSSFVNTWWATPVGQDGIAVIVNPSNPIANLTAAQLRTIWQGQILNWKNLDGQNVNGPDLPITVVLQSDSSSATMLIQRNVMGDRRFTRAARLAPTNSAVVDIVTHTPGAIGYVSINYLNKAVRSVSLESIPLSVDTLSGGKHPLSMPLVFVGKSEPGDNAYRAFFAWVQSPDGQTVVRRHTGGLP